MSKVREYINDGRLWKNTDGKWCKKCPKCNSIVESKGCTDDLMYSMSYSITKNQVCHSCIKIGKPTWSSLNREIMAKKHSGINHPMYGRKQTDKTKLSQRNRYLGTKLSDYTKQKVSESVKRAWGDPVKRKNMLDRCKWINTAVDKGQRELIDKWNNLGFKFEINYMLKTGTHLFYIDGYDPIHNIVIEYDSKYHNKSKQQKKDLIRQELIINILKPKKFWRYNSTKKTFVLYLYKDMTTNKQQPATVVA